MTISKALQQRLKVAGRVLIVTGQNVITLTPRRRCGRDRLDLKIHCGPHVELRELPLSTEARGYIQKAFDGPAHKHKDKGEFYLYNHPTGYTTPLGDKATWYCTWEFQLLPTVRSKKRQEGAGHETP